MRPERFVPDGRSPRGKERRPRLELDRGDLDTVREGNRDYRVFEFCCWEFPDDYSRSAYITEAGVRHTLETLRKVLPVDIYLETGSYGWSGILNQPSGTWAERFAKLKTNPQLWVNRDIFSGLSAAREADFEQKIRRRN